MPTSSDHFQGKSVPEHLKDARKKGALASAELHGVEMSGSLCACADAAKEMTLLLSFLALLFHVLLPPSKLFLGLCLVASAWILWKTARSALLGWSRVERLHRLIEEERWEIQHHRSQEKEELAEMYQAKGLTSPLLEQVVDVFMADDNRLLQLMLEEELGLTLEAYEHPLKQAWGAFAGACAVAALALLTLFFSSLEGLLIINALLLGVSSALHAKLERNQMVRLVVWHLATAGLVCGVLYFLIPLVLS